MLISTKWLDISSFDVSIEFFAFDIVFKKFDDITIKSLELDEPLRNFILQCESFVSKYNYKLFDTKEEKETFAQSVDKIIKNYKNVDNVVLQQLLLEDKNYSMLSFLKIIY